MQFLKIKRKGLSKFARIVLSIPVVFYLLMVVGVLSSEFFDSPNITLLVMPFLFIMAAPFEPLFETSNFLWNVGFFSHPTKVGALLVTIIWVSCLYIVIKFFDLPEASHKRDRYQ